MGHIRLGTIPTSQPWRNVVAVVLAQGLANPRADRELRESGAESSGTGQVAGGGFGHTGSPGEAAPDYSRSVATIAAKTLIAAKAALRDAKNDEGVRYTFYLLSQLALASRNPDWLGRLAVHGLVVQSTDSLAELTVAFQSSVDEHLERRRASSDLAEFAQRAAGTALCQLATDRASTLFGDSGEELRHAVRSLSSPEGFGRLSQQFFGGFLAQFLNFYLSRVTAAELGTGSVEAIGDITAFNRALSRHCTQSAAIVKTFAAEWYSKTEYQSGIDHRKAGGFVAVAVQKLQAELAVQAER